MFVLWWFIIILLFLFSFIGVIMPIIPGLPLIWIGFLIYHFGVAPLTGINFWLTIIILSIVIFVIDYLASSAWVKRYGGSKSGALSAIGGVLLGPFIFGPIGIIIGPFIFVTVTELLQGYRFKKAVQIGFASLIGFVGGSLLKIILQLLMIAIFYLHI